MAEQTTGLFILIQHNTPLVWQNRLQTYLVWYSTLPILYGRTDYRPIYFDTTQHPSCMAEQTTYLFILIQHNTHFVGQNRLQAYLFWYSTTPILYGRTLHTYLVWYSTTPILYGRTDYRPIYFDTAQHPFCMVEQTTDLFSLIQHNTPLVWQNRLQTYLVWYNTTPLLYGRTNYRPIYFDTTQYPFYMTKKTKDLFSWYNTVPIICSPTEHMTHLVWYSTILI